MKYPSIRDPGVHAQVVSRIRKLSPESRQLWGKMRHDQLMVHLADGLRLALGESGHTKAKGPFQIRFLRYLIVHRLHWPAGKAKAPAGAFQRPATTWEGDRETLVTLLDQYAGSPAVRSGPIHPLFGRMSGRDWDVLVYRHLDHHLRQFDS